MSDNNVGLEASERDKTDIHTPPASVSGGDDTDKMAVMANLDGIEVSDAILKAMEDEALFEREKLARKGQESLMLPHDVDPAPTLPPAPPFGIPQDVRYQFNYPDSARGSARQGTFHQKPRGYNATPPFHQQMMTGPPERARRDFMDLEQKVLNHTYHTYYD